jgi:hypothetical protein
MNTSRTRIAGQAARTAAQPLATIAIDAVSPSSQGFTLTGQGTGADRSHYRLDINFDLPLDPRTRTVLGELLSQSDVTLYRSDTPPRNS